MLLQIVEIDGPKVQEYLFYRFPRDQVRRKLWNNRMQKKIILNIDHGFVDTILLVDRKLMTKSILIILLLFLPLKYHKHQLTKA